VVTVHGENFRNTSKCTCRFGGTVVSAQFVAVLSTGEGLMECTAPVAVVANAVAVEISLDSFSYTSNGVLFDFYHPSISSIFPTRLVSPSNIPLGAFVGYGGKS
jgi:hypothetical protein